VNARDLNRVCIPTDAGPDQPLADPGIHTDDASAYFRDIASHLIRHIELADYVFGCVAWLTHPDILRALAGRRGVALVVQKEDFLRPDGPTSKAHLRRLYARLPSLDRYQFAGTVLAEMSVCGDPILDAVRCVGNHNRTKSPAHPRAHHKFVVFAKRGASMAGDGDALRLDPTAVWTGSFNFTATGGRSLENAVVLRHPAIVRAYVQEFAQVAALSEPLNWSDDWCAPEWRIGT
jgi:hypothetical protein